MINSTEAW